MSTASVARAVTELLSAPVAAAGLDLEEVEVTRAGRRSVVAVVVDRDGGVGLDDVAEVSRVISDLLDSHDVVPGEYTLEVSSRGTSRPLTLPRHWRRNAGRLVAVGRRQAKDVTGRVLRSDDEAVTLDVDGTEVTVPFDDVHRAVVQVEFRRPDGVGAPGEPDDLDEDDLTDDDLTDDGLIEDDLIEDDLTEDDPDEDEEDAP